MPRVLDDVAYAQILAILSAAPQLGGTTTTPAPSPVPTPPPSPGPAPSPAGDYIDFPVPANGGRVVSPEFGDRVLALRFQTGSRPGTARISFAEYQSGPAQRVASLSNVPGLVNLELRQMLGVMDTKAGNGATFYCDVGVPTNPRRPLLAFNSTYYINIRNWDAASQQPTAGGTIGVDVVMP